MAFVRVSIPCGIVMYRRVGLLGLRVILIQGIHLQERVWFHVGNVQTEILCDSVVRLIWDTVSCYCLGYFLMIHLLLKLFESVYQIFCPTKFPFLSCSQTHV